MARKETQDCFDLANGFNRALARKRKKKLPEVRDMHLQAKYHQMYKVLLGYENKMVSYETVYEIQNASKCSRYRTEQRRT